MRWVIRMTLRVIMFQIGILIQSTITINRNLTLLFYSSGYVRLNIMTGVVAKSYHGLPTYESINPNQSINENE